MKVLVQFIFILFSVQAYSQPVLEPVYHLAALPSLPIDQINNSDQLLTFDHHEGILIYNKKDDQWKLFKHLMGYEGLGRIYNVFSFDGIIAVSMEKGSVVISSDRINTINVSILAAKTIGDELIFLSSNPDTGTSSRWSTEQNYHKATQIIHYNVKTGSLDITRLSRPFSRIQSYQFFNGKFYVLNLDEGGEVYWSSLLRIDSDGKVSDLSSGSYKLGSLQLIKFYKNNLYLFSSTGLFMADRKDSLIRVFDYNHSWQGVPSDKSDCIFIISSYSYNSKKIEIARVDLDDFSIKINSIDIPKYWQLNSDAQIKISGNKMFFDRELIHTIYRSGLDNDGAKRKYSFRDGLTGPVHYLAEDSTEVWFVSGGYGIFRFSKKNSTWTTYDQFMDIHIDTKNYLRHSQFSLNDDFVFFTMKSRYGHILQYLIFDRKTEIFNLLSEEEFIDRFFYFEGKFAKYNGEPFMSEQDVEKFIDIFNMGSKWMFLLFLYDMPLSGVSDSYYRNLMIRNKNYNMLSLIVPDTSISSNKGVMIKYKSDNSWKIYTYPRKIYDFDSFIVPYQIFGDDKEIYASGRGGNCKGIFSYNFESGICRSKPLWFRTFFDNSCIYNAENHVVVGSYERKLHVLNKLTGEIIDLSDSKQGSPRRFAETNSYFYVSTEKQTVYYNPEFNYIGELYPGNARLHKTDFNIYLSDHEKVYRLVEN